MSDGIGTDGACREFYIDNERVPLHAKLDFPEGFTPKEGGEKCPLVIVQHGFTGHMEEEHIIGVAHALNETGFATLRTELYGHGKSGGTFRTHTLFDWLLGIITVIDYARELDFVSDLFLCGHSQGGLTVMLAGAMKQDVIRGVIALSPAAMIPEDARRGNMLGNLFDPQNIPDTVEMEDGLRLSGNYIRVAQQVWVEPAIDAFKKDVLIIHGDEDETVPVQVAVDAAKRYEHAHLVLIRGDDHCYNYHLDQVLGELKKYMKKYTTS